MKDDSNVLIKVLVFVDKRCDNLMNARRFEIIWCEMVSSVQLFESQYFCKSISFSD